MTSLHLKNKFGMALVEIILAVFIFGLIAYITGSFLKTTRLRYGQVLADAQMYSQTDGAKWRMGIDIRSAKHSPNETEFMFIGRPHTPLFDQLQFATPTQMVRYIVEGDGQSDTYTLIRYGKEDKEEMLTGLRKFHVRYFDGHLWHPHWGWDDHSQRPSINMKGLPLLVEINIEFNQKGIRTEKTFRIPVMTRVLNRTIYEL